MTHDRARPAAGLPFAEHLNRVSTTDPFLWLVAGWNDLRQARGVSIGYACGFVVIGIALVSGLVWLELNYLVAPTLESLLLVGPAVTVGFQALSRDLEQGRLARPSRTLSAWRGNPWHLLAMGLILLLVMMVWLRIAVLIFAINFPYVTWSLDEMLQVILFTPEGWVFLIIGSLFGAFFASVVFVICVVSLPLMIDRRVSVFTAIGVSAMAVLSNLRPMAVWATLIVVIVGAGVVSGLIGLIFALPLVGHGAWHAYRALVRQPPGEAVV